MLFRSVSALLRIQARRVEDPGASAAIEEAVRRVASIAVVHETLSTSYKDSVAFDEVLGKIMKSALELSQRSSEISLERVGEFGEVPSILATPLALVLTELIHNALEHGLVAHGSRLRVEVVHEGSSMKVMIIDDGVGLPNDFAIERNMNLGLQIVKTLTENELAGKIEFRRREVGTEVEISFDLR